MEINELINISVDFAQTSRVGHHPKLNLLEQKVELLLERIAQYEIAFLAQAINDVRRLN